MNIQLKAIGELHEYANNPRDNDKAVSAVAASIQEFGFRQPLVIDTTGEVVCGHTRLKAAKKLGLTEVPVTIIDDLTPEQIRAFRIADNKVAELASWDIAALAVEIDELQAAGVDNLEDFGFDTSEEWWRQAAWKQVEKFCNLRMKVKANLHGSFRSTTFFETNRKGDGENIARLKEKPANVPLFSSCLVDFCTKTLGGNLVRGSWAIVTAPRRRHLHGFHFSTAICTAAATQLQIPFYADAVTTENRARIEPEFTLQLNPREVNVIFFDDVLTTGETARACRELLTAAGHNVFVIAGIRNNN